MLIPMVWIWLILALAGALGLTLALFGWRGRRVDDHPLCRRCGYDLHALAAPAHCPECGRDLARKRAVRVGHRRRRWRMMTPGALLLTVAIISAGTFGWATANDFNWHTIKPLWMLKREAAGNDASAANLARCEMHARLIDGRLSQQAIDAIVAEGLQTHDSASPAQRQFFHAFIQNGWTINRVSDAQFIAHLQHIVSDVLIVEVRSNVRRGTDPWIVLRHCAPRWTSVDLGLSVETRAASVWLHNRKVSAVDAYKRWPTDPYAGDEDPTVLTTRVPVELPPGLYQVGVECHMRVWTGVNQFVRSAPGTWHTDFTQRIEASIAVFDSPNSEVALLQNESARNALATDAIAFNIRRQSSIDGRGQISCDVSTFLPPVDIAFDVFLRDGDDHGDDHTLRLGSFTAARRQNLKHALLADIDAARAWLLDRNRVDVLLRPSIAAAEITPHLLEIWDGEIVFRDVPIERE